MTPLIEKARLLYAKCKDESMPGARVALVELRNMVPDLVDRLEYLEQDRDNWVEPPRLELGLPMNRPDPAKN
jgi:hypothetical protein